MSSKNIVPNPVPKLYNGVIDEVIAAVRDAVLDEGIDEAVLGDLKTLWKKKLDESRALEGPVQDHQQVMYVYMPKGDGEQAAPHRPEYPPPTRPVQFRQMQNHVNRVNPMAPPRVMPMGMPSPHAVHLQHQQMANMASGAAGHFNPQRHLHPHRPNQHLPHTNPLLAAQHERMLGRKTVPHPQAMQPPRNIQRVVMPNQGHHMQHHPGHVTHQSVIQQNHFQHRQIDGADLEDSDSDSDRDSSSAEEAEDRTNDTNQGDAESLNSADDVSDTNDNEIFDTENIVICQFDKIQRVRNKWRFHLKDGIMSLNGKDYVFQKATGDGEW